MITKVWVLHPDASGPSMKGLLRYFYFAKNLNKDDYEFKIFTSSKIRNSDKNLIDDSDKNLYIEKEDYGIKYIFIKTAYYEKNDNKRIKNWMDYYNNSIKVASSMIESGDKPDILIGSSPHPLAMMSAIKIGNRFGVPVINEVRDFWPEVFFLNGRVKENGVLGKILLRGERYIYENSDSLIFLKEGDFNYVIDRGWDTNSNGKINLNNINYINNGVDIESYQKKMSNKFKDIDLDSHSFKCVYTGSLRMVNNIDNILDAAKLLLNYEDISFLIYGDGEYKEKLLSRIKNEGLSNVKIKGYIDNKYIPYVLSKADVNILNYSDKYKRDRGNSSNKIFEYMASGKPIISTVKMGYSFITRYNLGLELQKNSPDNLAAAILEIKNKSMFEYNELCQNAKKAAEDFDYSILSQKLKLVIENLKGETI